MLDKSPKWVLDNNWIQIQKEFEGNLPSIVLCSETFHKIEFLNRLINSFEEHIIFVDIDPHVKPLLVHNIKFLEEHYEVPGTWEFICSDVKSFNIKARVHDDRARAHEHWWN